MAFGIDQMMFLHPIVFQPNFLMTNLGLKIIRINQIPIPLNGQSCAGCPSTASTSFKTIKPALAVFTLIVYSMRNLAKATGFLSGFFPTRYKYCLRQTI